MNPDSNSKNELKDKSIDYEKAYKNYLENKDAQKILNRGLNMSNKDIYDVLYDSKEPKKDAVDISYGLKQPKKDVIDISLFIKPPK